VGDEQFVEAVAHGRLVHCQLHIRITTVLPGI
jgi:hypothetical protein